MLERRTMIDEGSPTQLSVVRAARYCASRARPSFTALQGVEVLVQAPVLLAPPAQILVALVLEFDPPRSEHERDLVVRIEQLQHPLDAVRQQAIVGMQRFHELAARELERAAVIAMEADVGRVPEEPDPRVVVAVDNLDGVVRRRVVHDHDLEPAVGLRKRRVDRSTNRLGTVVDGDRDRHAWCG
jgi:hypothetical protein